MATNRAGKQYVQTYNDHRVTSFENHVATTVRSQIAQVDIQGPQAQDVILPFEEHAIFVVIRFNLVKPVSYSKSIVLHTRRPDLDNLTKAVLDGLQKARVFKDDGMICELGLSKHYVSDGHPEGVEIDLTAVRTPTP